MGDLKNEFSWSISSQNEFSKCKRMYYYTKYGSWEGWSTGTGDEKAKKLYLLKKLTKKEMWVGSVIHNVIKSIILEIRNGNNPTYNLMEKRLIEKMNKDITNSRQKLYRGNPKYYTGFFEDEYGSGLSENEINDSIEFAKNCLKNFFNLTMLRYIRSLQKNQLLTVDDSDFPSFNFEGTKIYANIDLAVKDGDRIKIYDWKTGKKDVDNSLQLACYLSFAVRKWKVAASKIDIFEVNLATNNIIEHNGLQANTDLFEDYLRKSISAIKSLLQDPVNNIAEEEDYEKINKTGYCSRCSYLSVCKPPVLPDGTIKNNKIIQSL